MIKGSNILASSIGSVFAQGVNVIKNKSKVSWHGWIKDKENLKAVDPSVALEACGGSVSLMH